MPEPAAAAAARRIALKMLQERGRGAVLVGVARVNAALERLLQAVLLPTAGRNDSLFQADRPLGSFGARISLAHRMGLIETPVERALHTLRRVRNAFAHSSDSASLADPAHAARLAQAYQDGRANPLWLPLEFGALQSRCCQGTTRRPSPAGLHPPDHDPGGLPGGHGPAAQALPTAGGDGLLWGRPPGTGWLMPVAESA